MPLSTEEFSIKIGDDHSLLCPGCGKKLRLGWDWDMLQPETHFCYGVSFPLGVSEDHDVKYTVKCEFCDRLWCLTYELKSIEEFILCPGTMK